MPKASQKGPGSSKTGRCAFVGCKEPGTTTYQSYDLEVRVCTGHREEWDAMCERARKAYR